MQEYGRLSRFIEIVVIICVLVAYQANAGAAEKKVNAILDAEQQEFEEYRNIVLKPLTDSLDYSIPDYRKIYLEKTALYENFLKKYPNSRLTAEVKLRLSEFYKDMELPEVYERRKEMYACLEEAQEKLGEVREKCITEFYRKTDKRTRDPMYTKKAIDLLSEVVEKYGKQKRYIMYVPNHNGFRFDDEDAGGYALYLLAKGSAPKDRVRIYEVIMKNYAMRPELKLEMESFMIQVTHK